MSAVSAVVNWGKSPKAFIFRNYNHAPGRLSRYAGGSGYRLWQAVRASSAAPGYFQEFPLHGDIHQVRTAHFRQLVNLRTQNILVYQTFFLSFFSRMVVLSSITPVLWLSMKADCCGLASPSSVCCHWELVAMITLEEGLQPPQLWEPKSAIWSAAPPIPRVSLTMRSILHLLILQIIISQLLCSIDNLQFNHLKKAIFCGLVLPLWDQFYN